MDQVIGIDLAKRVFQVHVVTSCGDKVNKTVSRDKILSFVAQQPTSKIVMEACGSANYWSRKFKQLGHEVKQISPQYVAPFRMGNKNDRNDAIAIVEADSRPQMRYVPEKAIEQQDIQCLHRIRQRLMKNRTALINQIRGLGLEYGIAIPTGAHQIEKCIPEYLEDGENDLTVISREFLEELCIELKALTEKCRAIEQKIKTLGKQDSSTAFLLSIPGVGPLGASALRVELGDGSDFKNGRHFSSYLGLVPREHSSGGKVRLLGISKRGDSYLRGLLIHGARSSVYRIQKLPESECSPNQLWIKRLLARVPVNKAIVALANKNARMAWALVKKQEMFSPS